MKIDLSMEFLGESEGMSVYDELELNDWADFDPNVHKTLQNLTIRVEWKFINSKYLHAGRFKSENDGTYKFFIRNDFYKLVDCTMNLCIDPNHDETKLYAIGAKGFTTTKA